MAWYNQPIRPLDPVNPDDQSTLAIRYVQDTFKGTGQDSFTEPPGQNQAQWQALTNVMPITEGVISRRRGTQVFAATSRQQAPITITNYQSDITNQRNILVSSVGNVQVYDEAGNSVNASLFNPVATNSRPVRSLTSRSYQYFFDGVIADSLKWDGGSNLTNWGIDSTNVIASTLGGGVNSLFGPNTPTVVSQNGTGNTWSSINNVKVEDGAVASVLLIATGNAQVAASNALVTNAYSFAIPAGVVIQGITVNVKCLGNGAILGVQLLKNGVPYATAKGSIVNNEQLKFLTFGSTTDLWGGNFSAADINSTKFGVQITARGITGSGVSIDVVKISVNIAPPSVNSSGPGIGITGEPAGNINLTVGRIYYLIPRNSLSGHYGDLTPASVSTGPLTSQNVNLLVANFTDTQVDYKIILATADGGDPSVLYFLVELPNDPTGMSQTTYVDSTPDSTLVFNQPYLFTDEFGNEFGVTLNDPPPQGNLCIKHQGRLWMAGIGASAQDIFFSKSVNELTLPNGFIAGKYEESWPGSNYFDIAPGAETVTGLLTDGQTLYIGTQAHVRRLVGTDPSNFQEPQIVHPEVGVIRQEVWQICYMEGAPAGAIWMTPDFRVVQSDFNNYVDIGHAVQNILNSINSAGATLAHAMFVADGEFDLYILSVPVNQTSFCDTQLVYDLRSQQWFVWHLTPGSSAMFFNIAASGFPQWLFVSGDTTQVQQILESATTDNGTNINYSATTSWLHLGEPTKRKLLDEIEITGDPGMTVSVSGASTQTDFLNPVSLVNNRALTLGPFGQYKVYLASANCKYRYYQFTFTPSPGTVDGLIGYNIRMTPFNSL